MFLSILKSRLGQLAIALLVGAGLGAYSYYRIDSILSTPKVVIHETTNTKEIFVDKPVLTTKVVTQFIPDTKSKAIVADLLAQNDALKVQVTTLTDTIATATSSGGGPVVTLGSTVPVPTPNVVREFKDFQLDAKYDNTTFAYSLSQQFEILSSTGRTSDGLPTSTTQLFQLAAEGKRMLVPSKTTAIYADLAQAHWEVKPVLQLGLSVSNSNAGNEGGGVVAVQWLKHGKSQAAEDVRWAVASPSFYLSSNRQALTTSNKELGFLPFSFNLGTVQHSPFTNLWVSPLYNPSGLLSAKRVGLVVSATF